MPPTPASTAHTRSRGATPGALTATVATAIAGAIVLLAPAAAHASVGPGDTSHDPIGYVHGVSAVAGGLRVFGWAADPDARTSNIALASIIDGRNVTVRAKTSRAWSTITTKYRIGPTPGFLVTVPVPSGKHTACLIARNTGAGLDTVLSCVPTPLGRRLSPAQVDKHDPRGAITHRWSHRHSLHFQGWASDPDYVARRSVVVLYLDGRAAMTVYTRAFPRPRPADAGFRSAFDLLVPASVGTHVGCVWVVNTSLGHNTFLGCRTLDTRGPSGSGVVSTPSLNRKVAAEAITHRGQPYVWGATGPRQFDCSGLVVYSYKKFGYTTPRISQDQRVAARLIPASRAVPGDLVFYHDQLGDVYHVGIYVSPGRTVAAIDTQQGVNWQRIWDASSTTYGSFTHT